MEHAISLGAALTIFGAAFGCWAWVVAWGVSIIRKEVGELKLEIQVTGRTQQTHINQTERRLTMLETEFAYVKAHLLYKAAEAPNGREERHE